MTWPGSLAFICRLTSTFRVPVLYLLIMIWAFGSFYLILSTLSLKLTRVIFLGSLSTVSSSSDVVRLFTALRLLPSILFIIQIIFPPFILF